MSRFLNNLHVEDLGDDSRWCLLEDLVYESDLLGDTVLVPKGFITDLASVPRIPVIFEAWGNRSHHEAVIHDYLYTIGALPDVNIGKANKVFLEAMKVRNKPDWIAWPMYEGVCIGGFCHWKREKLEDRMIKEVS
jgi:hypothetical protein